MKRRLKLRADTVRMLTALDLGRAIGGVPSSFPQCFAARPGTSEAAGELCPTDYSWTCKTG